MKPRTTPQEQLPAPVSAPRRQASLSRIALPEPAPLRAALREALERRRSVREYSGQPLRLDELAALLWAAQGITSPAGLRTAPSAGAIYPVKSYLLCSRIEGLPAGFYQFDPDSRELRLLSRGDRQKRMAKLCGNQQCIEDAAAGLLLTAWYGRLRREYGENAERFALIEAGHIGQNWHLAAAALGLGSVSIGSLDATATRLLLPIPEDEYPLYFLLAGRK